MHSEDTKWLRDRICGNTLSQIDKHNLDFLDRHIVDGVIVHCRLSYTLHGIP